MTDLSLPDRLPFEHEPTGAVQASAEYRAAEQAGLFRSSFTPVQLRVEPCRCCPDAGGAVVIPTSKHINGPDLHLVNGQKIIAHFYGPDAYANAHRFTDWHNAQLNEGPS